MQIADAPTGVGTLLSPSRAAFRQSPWRQPCSGPIVPARLFFLSHPSHTPALHHWTDIAGHAPLSHHPSPLCPPPRGVGCLGSFCGAAPSPKRSRYFVEQKAPVGAGGSTSCTWVLATNATPPHSRRVPRPIRPLSLHPEPLCPCLSAQLPSAMWTWVKLVPSSLCHACHATGRVSRPQDNLYGAGS